MASNLHVTLKRRNATDEDTLLPKTTWAQVLNKPATFTPTSHTHDDRYYTESETNTLLAGKAASSHTHDDRYYTESETNTLLSGKAATSYVDAKISLKSDTDNRSVATVPNDYNSKFEIKGLKSNTAIGITGGGTYSALLGIRGWTDSSGGEAHELAFDSSGRIGHRYGSTTAWNAWKLLIESDDSRLSNSRPASDVYAWAKEANKPSYSYTEVGAAAASHTHSPSSITTNADRILGRIGGGTGGATELTVADLQSFLGLGSAAYTPSTNYLLSNASAVNSNKLGGLNLNSTTRNDEVNKVMRTDGNGYANFGWINTLSGDTTNASTDYYVNTNDGYIRKKTLANVRVELVTSSAVIAGLGYTPARVQGRVVNDMNHADYRVPGMYGINGSPANGYGESYGALIVAANSDTGLQIAGGHSNDDLYFRGWSDGGASYTSWRKVWHGGNLTNLNQLTNGPGYTTNTGTVTSVSMTVPTGLSISGSPITTSGTLALSLASGYSIPTTTKQGQWDSAYTSTNAANNSNVANAIVKRDAYGNFSAGTITATFSGNLTGNVTGTASGNLTSSSSLNPANVSQTSSYRFVTDAEKTAWNGKQNASTAWNTSNLTFSVSGSTLTITAT